MDQDDYKIYPMLLLPLLENAFKHGDLDNKNDKQLSVQIKIIKGEFSFQIKNAFSKKITQKSNNEGGIGLSNLRESIEMIYPNKSNLKIKDTDNIFDVS